MSDEDIFADEERAGSMIKSLISAQPLQAAWTKIGARLEKLERAVLRTQSGLETAAESSRSGLADLDARHEALLQGHAEAERRLDELTSRLESAGSFERREPPQPAEPGRRYSEAFATTQQRQSSLEERQEALAGQLQELQEGPMKRQVEEQLRELERSMQARLEEVSDGMEALSRQVTIMAEEPLAVKQPEGAPDEVRAQLSQALEEAQRAREQQGQAQQRRASGLSADIQRVDANLAELHAELARQAEDTAQQIGYAGKDSLERYVRLQGCVEAVAEELRACAQQAALKESEESLGRVISDLSAGQDMLRQSVVHKLNEIVNHIAMVQEKQDDHEACLLRHAEEFENRGTKYDVLVCQKRIDKCVVKEEFSREVDQIKQLMNWQSDKIGEFSIMSPPVSPRLAKQTMRSSTWADLGSCLEDDDAEVHSPMSAAPDISISAAEAFRRQLEAVSTGLLALGNTLLAQEPKLGSSRKDRLREDRELLNDLQGVRMWVTNRVAPSGWQPNQMMTAALQNRQFTVEDAAHGAPLSPKSPKPTQSFQKLARLAMAGRRNSLPAMPHSAREKGTKSPTPPGPVPPVPRPPDEKPSFSRSSTLQLG